MGSGKVPLEDLEIKLTLSKNPEEYPTNRLQKRVGSELNSKQGDTIKYYKSKVKGGATSNLDLLSTKKYLEMLESTFKDGLKVMGFDSKADIMGQQHFR